MGSLADTSSLQANFFTNLWEKIVETPENKSDSLFGTTLEGYRLPKETKQAFFNLHEQEQRDRAVLLGAMGGDEFVVLLPETDTDRDGPSH